MNRILLILVIALLPWLVQADTVRIAGDNGRPLAESNGGIPVDLQGLQKGENVALDRTFGGPLGNCRAFTADGVILAQAGMLISVYITAAEVNDDFLIYDNASAASGTVLYNRTNVAAGDKSDPNVPAAAANGLYLDVTAADASAAFVLTICYL